MAPTETEILRRLAEADLSPPRAVTLAVTNRCNLNCAHCWPRSGPETQAPEVPPDRIERLVESFAALGAESLTLTGGEPLTRPDWARLLAFACSRPGIREVRLQTNAVLITPQHLDTISDLVSQGLIIQTSLEGATPAAHDRVRGAGSFKRTLQGLELLQQAGLASSIVITFTEMAHNFGELPSLLELAESMGARQFISGTLVLGGRAAQAEAIAPPTARQYEQLLERYDSDTVFRERYRRIGNIAAIEWAKAEAGPPPPCCSLIETPYLTPEGALYPCVLLQAAAYAATGLYARPLAAALEKAMGGWSRLQQISRSRSAKLSECHTCPGYTRCGGGCMGRAYAAQGTFLTVEDRCAQRQAVYRTCIGRP